MLVPFVMQLGKRESTKLVSLWIYIHLLKEIKKPGKCTNQLEESCVNGSDA